MKTNYNLLMKEMLSSLSYKPKLLLHSCCGPCSTSVIERLEKYFEITIFYYNPNIEPYEEYLKRKNEQIRFLRKYPKKIDFLDCDYDNESYEKIVKGLEKEKEGGIRCHKCYELRLLQTAKKAKESGYEFFGTTLTVSPYKNAEVINTLGQQIAKENDLKFLVSDFKKEDGYKRSIDLSKDYNLYRQDYCGCQYSNYHDISE